MTIAEIDRAIQSKAKVMRIEEQERASHNYLLANMIGKQISIILTGKGTFPSIYEVYPNLFDDVKQEQEDKVEKQKVHLSTLRFKQFAQSYNDRYKNKGVQIG